MTMLQTDIERRLADSEPEIEVLLAEVAGGRCLRVFIDHPDGVTLAMCERVTLLLNDLREPAKASADFRTALRLQPNYGEAHLGLAYADLQLHRPQPALIQLESAQKLLGKSHAYHLARAHARQSHPPVSA